MARQCVDRVSGEILEEPEFVKVYIANLCAVKGITTAQSKMFNFMLMNMNWENTVSYGPSTKAKFLAELGIKNQTFNNNVTALIASGLIERIGRGEFRINKKYAVKVEWSKVQSIKWTTTYTKAGKVERVVFDSKTGEI